MATFSGIVSGAGDLVKDGLGALGFDWATGAIKPPVTVPITIGLQVDDESPAGAVSHFGGVILNVPNHGPEFGDMAINMAQETLAMIELVVALQTISDPAGGIVIKDQLDPYHYEVVKRALEENGEKIPEPANTAATNWEKIGGAITASGAISGLGTALDAMETAGYGFEFLKFTPTVSTQVAGVSKPGPVGDFTSFSGRVGTPIYAQVIGFWPSYVTQLGIINSALSIKITLMNYAVSLLRNSIDTSAKALVLKHVLDDFSLEVSNNAIENSQGPDRVPPFEPPQGQGGIF